MLNALDLKINKVEIDVDGKTIVPSEINLCPKDELLTLVCDETLGPGTNAELAIEFTGELNDKMKGFYKSKYLR